jgi:DNA-binding CsgD family transcriptional regulator
MRIFAAGRCRLRARDSTAWLHHGILRRVARYAFGPGLGFLFQYLAARMAARIPEQRLRTARHGSCGGATLGDPFTWVELLRDRKQTKEQIKFHDRVRELGVIDGYAVPIHLPGGDLGLCVSVATHIIDDTEERLALHMASLYAHDRCRALGGLIEASSAKTPLSPRELECLKWVLDGKSDTDIGGILGISHNTVHFHVERVKKKLGVRTRTQAAAMVMTLGYL